MQGRWVRRVSGKVVVELGKIAKGKGKATKERG